MLNNDVFEPKTPLEQQLVAAKEGDLGGEAFIGTLLESVVFVPMNSQPAPTRPQGLDTVAPLVVTTENGTEVLVLFTAPERAKGFLARYPGYESGLLAEFNWVVAQLGTDHGISLNPGCTAGLDLGPDVIRRLRQVQTSNRPAS